MAYPIVKELIKEFGDNKIRFVFRNFPLNDIHPHAQAAAEAAEAAAAQDKFWEMHDYLFEHHKALDDVHLLESHYTSAELLYNEDVQLQT